MGLYLQPTLVNNVETFANVPVVLREGGQPFLELGTPEGGGTKLICLSGHVKNPGTYEVNLGTPLSDILYSEEYGGGSSTGLPLKFIHFGGQSGPIGAVKDLENCLYSYEGLWDYSLAVGSGALVVMDESVNILDYLVSVAAFFAHESCGKCTPCRLGTTRMLELLETFQRGEAHGEDLDKLNKMMTHITNLSACGLGQSVSMAARSAMKCFYDEFIQGIGVYEEKVEEVMW